MEQLQIATLEQARSAIQRSHHKAMTSFVELGYIFRQVGDQKLYEQGGYATLNDFAQEEYNYSPAQVSRFISINMEFSIEGNTPILAEKYEKFAQTKLVEMLKLPESIRENIDPEMKRDEIRQLTKDVEAANEAATEEDFVQVISGEEKKDPVDRVILDILTAPKIKERFVKIFDQLNNQGTDRDICLAFMENGFGNLSLRTSTIFFKGNMVKIIINDKTSGYSYSDLLDAIRRIRQTGGESAEEYYENLTGEKLKEEEPVDNVEKATPSKKETPKPKKETKTEEKPEVEHCAAQPEEEKSEEENPLPKPVDSEPEIVEAEVVEEEKIVPHNHEAKALTHKVIAKVFGDTKALHIYRTGEDGKGDYDEPVLMAAFEIDYCPFCGVKL